LSCRPKPGKIIPRSNAALNLTGDTAPATNHKRPDRTPERLLAFD